MRVFDDEAAFRKNAVAVTASARATAMAERCDALAVGVYVWVKEAYPHLVVVSEEQWTRSCAAALAIAVEELSDERSFIDRLLSPSTWRRAWEAEGTRALRVHGQCLRSIARSGGGADGYRTSAIGFGMWLVESGGLSLHSGSVAEWMDMGDVFSTAVLKATGRMDWLRNVETALTQVAR
jgi:hypothetical protein